MKYLLLTLILSFPLTVLSQEKQSSPQITEKEQKQEEAPSEENKPKSIDLNSGPYKDGQYRYFDRQRIEAQEARDEVPAM